MLQSPTTESSAAALAALSTSHLKNETDRIYDIVMAAHLHGIDDMSGREIQARYELLHGKRIDSGSVSARISSLISARRLERCRIARACLVTGSDIRPVRVVAQQSRLVA